MKNYIIDKLYPTYRKCIRETLPCNKYFYRAIKISNYEVFDNFFYYESEYTYEEYMKEFEKIIKYKNHKYVFFLLNKEDFAKRYKENKFFFDEHIFNETK